MEIGVTGKAEATVSPEKTALAMGSGTLPVFATPALVALMEQAAAESVATQLPAGQTTVGTLMAVKHLRATPEGAAVWAESELVSLDGRKLTFSIRAFDEKGVIGEAEHERFVVEIEKFMAKAMG